MLLAFRLFDTEGVRFVNALQQGRDGFNDLVESFSAFGIISNEQAQSLAALDISYQQLGTTLRAGLAAAVAESADELTELNRRLAADLPRVIETLVDAVGFLANNFDRLRRIVGLFLGILAVNRLRPFAVGLLAIAGSMTTLRTAALAAGTAVRFLVRSFILPLVIVEGVLLIVRAFSNLREELLQTSQTFQDVGLIAGGQLVQGFIESILSLPAAFIAIVASIQNVGVELFRNLGTASFDAFRAGFSGEDISDAFTEGLDIAGAIERVRDGFATAFDAFDVELPDNFLAGLLGFSDEDIDLANTTISSALQETWDDTRRAWVALTESAPLELPAIEVPAQLVDLEEIDLSQLPERIEPALVEVESRFDQVADRASRAFGRFAVDAITDFGDIGDAARRLGQQILEALIQALIVDQLVSSLSGAISGAFAGAGAGATPRQGGGPAFAGQPYLVGEGGPELFVPEVSGQVIPSGAFGGLGGAVFNFAPVISGGASGDEVEQALARAYPVFEDNIRGSILADLGRPSAFSRQRSR